MVGVSRGVDSTNCEDPLAGTGTGDVVLSSTASIIGASRNLW